MGMGDDGSTDRRPQKRQTITRAPTLTNIHLPIHPPPFIHHLPSVTAGIDALGEVTVRLEDLSTGKIYYGRSANTDVVVRIVWMDG